jgi:hypothetical protein
VKNLIFPKRQRYPVWIKPVRSWPVFTAAEDSSQRFQTLGDLAKETFVHPLSTSLILPGSFSRGNADHDGDLWGGTGASGGGLTWMSTLAGPAKAMARAIAEAA